jgi:hypothetical protein
MAQDFNVTTADVSAQVHNLDITPKSSPTMTAVQDMIDFYAAEIAREADVVGIDTSSLASGTDEFTYGRQALIAAVAGEVLVSKNRGNPDSGKFYTDKYRRYISNLRKRPQVQAETGEGPNLSRSILDDANPNERVYRNRIVGGIICGNSL